MPCSRGWFGTLTALAVTSYLAPAGATECQPASGISPCFEADALRVPPAHARFGGIASPRALSSGQAAFSLASSFVLEPLLLSAPSPDPQGREIPVVERELGVIVGVGLGLGNTFELQASLPASVARSGTGVEGVTSQHGEPLPRTAVRDPRLGLAWSPLPKAVETRLEVSLPFGDEAWLAGYAGPAVLPAVSGELTLGRFVLAGELGARLGEAVDFATTRQGNELFVAAGVGFGVLDPGLLDLSLELWLRPPLESEPERGHSDASTSGLPAEWLFGVTSGDGEAFSIFAGGGSGLPFAREGSVDGSQA
ncbi:MAG TPA: hypothetical protein VM686_01070, partial [Polyangiaceae bacterium]|nr:hypothetical protein [Polyangiaceae bacterium]